MICQWRAEQLFADADSWQALTIHNILQEPSLTIYCFIIQSSFFSH